MSRSPLQAALLAAVLVLAGCAGGISGGTPTADRSSTTAHFLLNNHHAVAFDVAVSVVAGDGGDRSYFPLAVTLRNGTTVTVTDTDEVPAVPGPLSANATRIEPANGTVATVEAELPARSTLHVVVEGVPADAKSMVVRYRQGDARRPVAGYGLSSGVCTGTEAHVDTLKPKHTSSVSCGNLSDRDFPNATVRRVVAANGTAAQAAAATVSARRPPARRR